MSKCPREINDELYRDEWQWQEGDLTVTRNTQWSAPGCHNGCGVLHYTDKDGKLVKIEGDPKSPIYNGRLCMRCLAVPEAVDHFAREYSPMKRIGERGEDKWEKISWDEAYDIIEDYVKNEIDAKGFTRDTIVVMHGTGRNATWQGTAMGGMCFRTSNASVHGFLSGDACYVPRVAIMGLVQGDIAVMDCAQALEQGYDDPRYVTPEVCLIWACNPIVSNADGFLGHWIVDLMRKGMKLITVDPRLTWLGAQAEYMLQLRPGTDAALAMAMMDVIIKEDLYDHEFVECWTYGFEQLAERVATMPVERAAEITGVPEDQIIGAARMYANAKPAAIQWGLKLDQIKEGTGAIHAVICLWGLTGNVDVPGGNILMDTGYIQAYARNLMSGEADNPEMRLGKETYPLRKLGVCNEASTDVILQAMETGEPYPIKMMVMQSTNAIVNMGPESKRIFDAMQKVPFTVVMDVYKTPTMIGCADLFLPVAMSTERVGVRGWYNPLRTLNKIQETNARSDEQIIIDLCKRLNPEAAKWDNQEEFYNAVMESIDDMDLPEGFSYDYLKEHMYYWEDIGYRKYETGRLRKRTDGKPGFGTPTGRFEFYCTTLAYAGHDPLPYYEEPDPSPISDPEYAKKYPLFLTTGRRSWEFFHSEHRNLKSMREFHRWPQVEMTPETAAKYGIKEGDWVLIENQRGTCKEMCKYNASMHPNTIMAEHGWWFPEREAGELFGAFESNVNVLTPMCDCGANGFCAPYTTQMCKISRLDDYNPEDFPISDLYKENGWEDLCIKQEAVSE